MRCARSLLLLLLLAGCGGLRARIEREARAGRLRTAVSSYERLRERDGPSPELRAALGGWVLLRAARNGHDEARGLEAVAALRGAGRPARPWLDALLWDRNVRDVARAEAAEVLARWGDPEAQALLMNWRDHPDPRVRARTLRLAAGPETRGALRHGVQEERLAAVTALTTAAPDPAARVALASACRRDGDARVRRAACQALGAFGPSALPVLLERLAQDPSLAVRLTAVGAALRADLDAALAATRSWWSRPISPEGVEAARCVARDASGAPRLEALAILRSALQTPRSALRAQAAVAWISVGAHLAEGTLLDRLRKEQAAPVRLQIARALLRTRGGRERAVDALRALGRGKGLLAVQALADLARLEDTAGRWAARRLRRLSKRGEPSVRRLAVRGLALDAARPDEVVSALLDPDRTVRYAAASALIATGP